jgi:hypothetical protein
VKTEKASLCISILSHMSNVKFVTVMGMRAFVKATLTCFNVGMLGKD